MIRYDIDGSIVFHALVRYNKMDKTLSLRRRLDGEPVGGAGWQSDITWDLDGPVGGYIDITMQSWLEQEPGDDR